MVTAMDAPEVYFAQHLAANDSKIRFRAFKKLKIWLTARSVAGKAISESEMLKIWKGLHYCMWMCDKPLVQEKLADKISSLIHCLVGKEPTILFIDVFFQTMAREWFGIDRFRIEKFMMFMRKFLQETFQFLKRQKFKISVVKPVLKSFRKTVINPVDETIPGGIKYHMIDIYLDELGKATEEELSPKQLRWFIRPYAEFLVSNHDSALCGAVAKDIFHYLIWQAKEMNEEEEEGDRIFLKFNVNFGMISKLFLKLASGEEVKSDNRKRLYRLVGQFRDMSNGTFPLERTRDEDLDMASDIDEDEIEAAARRMLKMEKREDGNENFHRNRKFVHRRR